MRDRKKVKYIHRQSEIEKVREIYLEWERERESDSIISYMLYNNTYIIYI